MHSFTVNKPRSSVRRPTRKSCGRVFDKRYAFTEMINPDFVAVAKGFGIEAQRVDTRESLDTAIREMIVPSMLPVLAPVVVYFVVLLIADKSAAFATVGAMLLGVIATGLSQRSSSSIAASRASGSSSTRFQAPSCASSA